MVLDPNKLRDELVKMSKSTASSFLLSGRSVAEAYSAYASEGSFLDGSVKGLDAQLDALAQVLSAGFSTLTLQGTADAFASGLTAFWVSIPVVGSAPGVTVGCPGAALLREAAGLPALFSTPKASTEAAMIALAVALDSATRTVTAVVTVPGTPPVVMNVPIT